MDLDRLKREVICALFADNFLVQHLVLKGGNLLDVVYGISSRPSKDIDLSIAGEMDDIKHFRHMIERALQRWLEAKDYVVFDVTIEEKPKRLTEELRDFWGGYKIKFKMIERSLYEQCAGDVDAARQKSMECLVVSRVSR